MVRRNLTVANHWSQAWTELLGGIAKAGIGDGAEAATRLDRAVIVLGQFDHPLTGVALLEQGKLAMAAGDHRRAGQLFLDASVSGYAYDDLDVVTESLRLGWVNFLAGGGSGVYGPLEPAAAWAQTNRLWLVAATLRLAGGEFVAAGAVAGRGGGGRRHRPAAGRDAGRTAGNEALVSAGGGAGWQGSGRTGGRVAASGARGARIGSLRNFEIARATELFDAGDLTPRVAPDVFGPLLGDPTPADWTQQTFDTLAVISTPHGPRSIVGSWVRSIARIRPRRWKLQSGRSGSGF